MKAVLLFETFCSPKEGCLVAMQRFRFAFLGYSCIYSSLMLLSTNGQIIFNYTKKGALSKLPYHFNGTKLVLSENDHIILNVPNMVHSA